MINQLLKRQGRKTTHEQACGTEGKFTFHWYTLSYMYSGFAISIVI